MCHPGLVEHVAVGRCVDGRGISVRAVGGLGLRQRWRFGQVDCCEVAGLDGLIDQAAWLGILARSATTWSIRVGKGSRLASGGVDVVVGGGRGRGRVRLGRLKDLEKVWSIVDLACGVLISGRLLHLCPINWCLTHLRGDGGCSCGDGQ